MLSVGWLIGITLYVILQVRLPIPRLLGLRVKILVYFLQVNMKHKQIYFVSFLINFVNVNLGQCQGYFRNLEIIIKPHLVGLTESLSLRSNRSSSKNDANIYLV